MCVYMYDSHTTPIPYTHNQQQSLGFLRPATGTPIRRGNCQTAAAARQRLPVLMAADGKEQLEGLRFLTPAAVEKVAADFGTPVYVYDMKTLADQARKALAFPNAYGLTVRYAMKASPNAAILKVRVVEYSCGCGQVSV